MRQSAAAIVLFSLWLPGCMLRTDDAAPPLPDTPLPLEQIVETDLPERLPILQLLRDQQFDSLDGLFVSLQEGCERDCRTEGKLRRAFGAFEVVPGTEVEPLLDAWVNRNPGSPWALMGRATYLNNMGWFKRGGRWISETPRENLEQMTDYHARAQADVERAVALQPRLLLAREILLGDAMAAGDTDEVQRQARAALDVCPEAFYLRVAWIKALEPRWGGSYGQMMQVAREAERLADRNPRLRLLPGFVYYDQARLLSSDKRYEEAIQAFDRAIAFGDWYEFLADRAFIRFKLDRHREALADYNRAMAARPANEDLVADRARVRRALGDLDGAYADMRATFERWPYVDAIEEWAEGLPQDAARLAEMGRVDTAKRALGLAIELPPQGDWLMYGRGYVLAAEGNLTEAAAVLREYLDLHPDDQHTAEVLKQLLASLGRAE